MLNATLAKKRKPHSLLLGYSSLLARCLRLVSYATGALPHLRLRAFRGRSSLPSLCYRVAGNSVAALLCEIPAANNCGRGGFKPSRLLDLLSLKGAKRTNQSSIRGASRYAGLDAEENCETWSSLISLFPDVNISNAEAELAATN